MQTGNGAAQQRDFEQRALRKVRALVDRLDSLSAVENRRQRAIITGVATAVLLGVGGLTLFGMIGAHLEAGQQKRRACELAWKIDRVQDYERAVREGLDPSPGSRVSFEKWYEGLKAPAAEACATR
jgi:hypothetical protein